MSHLRGRPLCTAGLVTLGLGLSSCTREVGAGSFEIGAVDAGRSEAPLDRTRWPQKVVFGLVPYLPAPVMRREFSRLARALAKRVGIGFEVVVTRDYEDLRFRLRREEVDFAQLSPANYVRAKREMPDLQLVVTQIADGSPTYQGYLLVRAESSFERVEDLRGRRFCWVDPDSASGYLYPRALLRKRGIDPDRYFASPPIWSGNHLAAVEALTAGGCDIAAVYAGALKEAWARGIPPDSLRIIAKTERIPFDAYCLRPGLPASLATAIRRALLGISTRTGEGRAILGKATRINGFMIAYDDAYDGVRRMERSLEREEQATRAGATDAGPPRHGLDAPTR